jgi:hypothetical protein
VINKITELSFVCHVSVNFFKTLPSFQLIQRFFQELARGVQKKFDWLVMFYSISFFYFWTLLKDK